MDRERLDYLANTWSDEDLRTVWKYSTGRPWAGRDAVLEWMWQDAMRELRRSRICRARWGRRLAMLRLLWLLLWFLAYSVRVFVPRRERRGDRLQPQAGHGALAPLRGSPAGWTPTLALPGAPPP